jgi:Glucoamylase and related glycosyl hydrolases
MKTKILLACIILFTSVLNQAQNIQYDPLLDLSVKVLKKQETKGNGEYMWYPGQLSAHLQQKRIKESGERCVNVGYPGKFYAPLNKTLFRKECNFSSETTIEWTSTGKVRIIINGKKIDETKGSIRLPKGKSAILLEVDSEDNLPAIKILFDGQVSVDGWTASTDGVKWNFAEMSPVFGAAGNMPLDDPEIDVEIYPASVLPVRNATIENEIINIQKNGYVLIDFFHLEVGKVSFVAKGNGKLTVFVGESPEEALNEDTKNFEQFPIESYTLSEIERQITLPERAVRYVRIFCEEECEISNIKFTSKVWPVDFMMSFECDDEHINNIWSASVASLHTCTHGFYLDGVKRDYLPWSMDAVVSTFAGNYIFGDEQVSRNSLSIALLPLNPQKSDIGIPDYPLHALIGFNHYYKRYGDFKTILSYRDRIEQLLKFYEMLQDERGFISANVGERSGFVPGWATRQGPDRKGTPAYAQIMLYYNYKIGADFSKKWGDKKSANHYEAKAKILKENIFKHFWNEKQGLFINGYRQNGEVEKTISHHAQYWAILADIFPEEHYDKLFERLPEIPYYKQYVSFEKGYEFIAYSKARKVREMWSFLLDVFGDWLEQGHTRFPENISYKKSKDEQLVFYSRPYGLSLCHGANGAPGIIAVLNGIAGFCQSETKLNHYIIRPDLMELNWANIEFPIKEGKIKLELSNNGKSKIEIPEGCKVDFIDKNNKKTTLNKAGTYNL